MLYNNLVIRVVLPLTLFSGTVAAGVGSELVQEPQIPKNKIDYAAKAALEAELNRARKVLEESRELLREKKYRQAEARCQAAIAIYQAVRRGGWRARALLVEIYQEQGYYEEATFEFEAMARLGESGSSIRHRDRK